MLRTFVDYDCGSYAVYLPYCSLLQPRPTSEARTPEERSPEERTSYAAALSSLPALLSHEAVPVLMLSSASLEAQPSSRAAFGLYETLLATTVKPSSMLFDLSKFAPPPTDAPPLIDELFSMCKGTRPPPILPDDFAAALATKSSAHATEADDAAALAALCVVQRPCAQHPWLRTPLANMRVDARNTTHVGLSLTALPLLACSSRAPRRYASFFSERFAPIDALLYEDNAWGDAEVEALCKVLCHVALPNCTSLWLSRNDVGDEGMRRVAKAISEGALDALEEVHLSGNPRASTGSRDEIQAARAGVKVHFDKLGGGRTNGIA